MTETQEQPARTTPVRIRMAVDGDVHYILKSWRETYARDSLWAKNIPRQIFHSHHRKILEGLLETCETVVACYDQDPTHLVGFCCYERIDGHLVIHFIFTRFYVRHFGIAAKMLETVGHQPGEPILTTHWTRDCERLPDRFRVVYNPYILFKQFRERLDATSLNSSEERQTRDPASGG